MTCLDENTIAGYFELKLSAEETAQLFAHVDQCAACARLFADCGRLFAAHGSSSGPRPLSALDRDSDGDGARSATLDGAATELPAVVAVVGRTAPGRPSLRARELTATLGRYRIDRVLGVGGMGVVYAAHDPELDRRVAIKLLRPDSRASTELLRARLVREAQAMARLSHPNVIVVHEVGAFAEQVFVVMELIDGTTLAEWLRVVPRAWSEIVAAFIAAGEGLAAAHQAGIVHRDFKPDNVLVSRTGRICVTDFGLASVRDGASPATGESGSDGSAHPSGSNLIDSRLTYAGLLVGTPAYMAPEQMRGAATDARSDVFSFCVALYEALYGVRPYGGANLEELRAATESGRIAPPKRMIGPSAHRRIIEAGLSPRAEDRPPAIADVLDVLRVDPAVKRRRRLVAAAVSLALVASVSGVVVMRQRARVCRGAEAHLAGIWDPARKTAIHAAFVKTGVPYAETMWSTVEKRLDLLSRGWVEMHTQACEATRIQGTQSEAMLDRRMSCLDDRLAELRAQSNLFVTADKRLVENAATAAGALGGLERCADLAALQLTEPPPLGSQKADVARVRQEIADAEALDNSGRIADEEKMIPRMVEDARRVGYSALEANALYMRSISLLRTGHLEEAIESLHDTATVAFAARADWLIVKAWQLLAFAIGHPMGKPAEALVWARYAQAASQRITTSPGDRAFFEGTYAGLLGMVGKKDEAMTMARHALVLAADKNMDPLYAAITRGTVGVFFSQSGHTGEALATFRELMPTFDRLLGPQHPNSIRTRTNLAGALLDDERWSEALPVAEAAAAAYGKLDPEHPSTAFALENVARAELGLGRLEDAHQHLLRVLAIEEKRKVGGNELSGALTYLAQVERAQHDPAALATAERAVAVGDAAKLNPELMADARLAVAEQLPPAARARARTLATQARDGLAEAAKGGNKDAARERDEADAWLRAHAP